MYITDKDLLKALLKAFENYDNQVADALAPALDMIRKEIKAQRQINAELVTALNLLNERVQNLEQILHDPSNIVKHRLRDGSS